MAISPDAFREVCNPDDRVKLGYLPRFTRFGVNRTPRVEHSSRRAIDRVGILEVTLVELDDVAEVDALDRLRFHRCTYRTLALADLCAIQRATETQRHRVVTHRITLRTPCLSTALLKLRIKPM